jgi:hypothetical protein
MTNPMNLDQELWQNILGSKHARVQKAIDVLSLAISGIAISSGKGFEKMPKVWSIGRYQFLHIRL